MMLRFLLILAVCFVTNQAFATRSAEVVTDGAMVYKKADFDSQVIGYLQRGQKVKVSDETTGAFYKVQFSQGVIGYISDVDVRVEGRPTPGKRNEDKKSNRRKKNREKPKEADKKDKADKKDNPWDEGEDNSWEEDNAKSPSFSLGPIVSYVFLYSEKRDDRYDMSGMKFFTYGLNVGIPMFNKLSLDISAHFAPYTSVFDKFYNGKDYRLSSGSKKFLSFPAMFLDIALTRAIFNISPNFGISAGLGINFPMKVLKITKKTSEDESDDTTTSGRKSPTNVTLHNVRFGGIAFLSMNYHTEKINFFIRPTFRYELTMYGSVSAGLTLLL